MTRRRPQLGQIVFGNHATCDVYSPKPVETLVQEKMLRILVALMRVKHIFFGFIKAFDLKRILNKLRIDGMR